jgi:hypothetical protein
MVHPPTLNHPTRRYSMSSLSNSTTRIQSSEVTIEVPTLWVPATQHFGKAKPDEWGSISMLTSSKRTYTEDPGGIQCVSVTRKVWFRLCFDPEQALRTCRPRRYSVHNHVKQVPSLDHASHCLKPTKWDPWHTRTLPMKVFRKMIRSITSSSILADRINH